MSNRLLCLCLVFGQLLVAPCCIADTGPWEPKEAPYSWGAAHSVYGWIDSHLQRPGTCTDASTREITILKNIARGTLIWAYRFGNIFYDELFLQNFSNKDETVKFLRLDDGGLIFSLKTGCIKISRDKSSPQGRISPERNDSFYPRSRWFATIFNESEEISFYFSAVGSFAPIPETEILSELPRDEADQEHENTSGSADCVKGP